MSDIINGRNCRLFGGLSELSVYKGFWYVSIFVYLSLQVTTICAIAITKDERFNNEDYFLLTGYLESLCMTTIAFVWFVLGVQLRQNVSKMQFRPDLERRLLDQVNWVVLTTTISFMLRAFLISLNNYQLVVIGINFPYILWALFTRWCPYIFCSFLLTYVLQKSKPSSNTTEMDNAFGAVFSSSHVSSDLLGTYTSCNGDDKTFSDDGDGYDRSFDSGKCSLFSTSI